VVESSADGSSHSQSSRGERLAAGIPVCGGGGDAVISTTGLGLYKPGRVAVTLGTSGVVAMALPSFMANPQGSLQLFRGNSPDTFTAMGVTLAAAGSYHWFCEALGDYEVAQGKQLGRSAFALLDEAAATTPAGAEGLIFLPYLTGERCPINDPTARGGFIGLTSHHKKGHFARAVLEGVAFSLRQVYRLDHPQQIPSSKVSPATSFLPAEVLSVRSGARSSPTSLACLCTPSMAVSKADRSAPLSSPAWPSVSGLILPPPYP